jgi:hypothetical protein
MTVSRRQIIAAGAVARVVLTGAAQGFDDSTGCTLVGDLEAVTGCKEPPILADRQDSLFSGLFDAKLTELPPTLDKVRYLHSSARPADNPGRWIEEPRLPIPVGEMGVVDCRGKIHVIGGYARQRVDANFHQVFDPQTGAWSLKAPIPFACNHLALAAIESSIFAFGGFIEQNSCPHSNCFVYDCDNDLWHSIAPLSRPRGAIAACVLDGRIHLLGGRDFRSVDWHEVYDPKADKYHFVREMPGSTKTQPFSGQRDHIGAAVVAGRIHAIGGRMDSYDFNTGLHTVYDPVTDQWSLRITSADAAERPIRSVVPRPHCSFRRRSDREDIRHQRSLRS